VSLVFGGKMLIMLFFILNFLEGKPDRPQLSIFEMVSRSEDSLLSHSGNENIQTLDVKKWDTALVQQWLAKVQSGDNKTMADFYAQEFLNNEITGEYLLDLDSDKALAEIGIQNKDHRKRFIIAINALKVSRGTLFIVLHNNFF